MGKCVTKDIGDHKKSEDMFELFPAMHEDGSTNLSSISSLKSDIAIKFHKVITRSVSTKLINVQGSSAQKNVSKQAEERSKTIKVAKTVAIVYGCFMVCWLPVSIFAIGLAWSHTVFSTVHAWPHVLVAEILPVLNSTMNPIIYSLKTRIYLKSLRKMMRKAMFWVHRYTRDGI